MQAVQICGKNLHLQHLPLPSNEEGIKLATASFKVFDGALFSAETSSCKIEGHVIQI